MRQWLLSRQAWLTVDSAPPPDVEVGGLDAGERETISLGIHRKADLVLLDEARGRRIAMRMGLKVAGTLGVLDRAAKRGLVDLNAALDRLQQTTFRASPDLLDSLRRRR